MSEIAIRNQAKEKLPYDTEVEYLESSGNAQYIDLGVHCSEKTIVDLDFAFFEHTTTVISWDAYFGLNDTGGGNNMVIVRHYANNPAHITSYLCGQEGNFKNISFGERHVIHLENNNTYIDDHQQATQKTCHSYTTLLNAYLFRSNNLGTPYGKLPCRIYAFKMKAVERP